MSYINSKTQKRLLKIAITLTIIFGVVIVFKSIELTPKGKRIEDTLNTELSKTRSARQSITFILGEDNKKSNPYYTEAANYYLFNDTEKTERVVMECKSLLEVRDYLAENPPSNNKPWGLINLVSHGNQWTGLSVKVTAHSKRATSEVINEYIDNDSLRPLPNHQLDNESEIFVHGCGMGNNQNLIRAIAKAFGGKDKLPIVRASKLFEYYSSTKNNSAVLQSQKYLANAWFTIYKRGYKPEDFVLNNLLNMKYPNCELNWKGALCREKPRWAGDTYHYTFDVPVKWVIKYDDKDSLPDLSSKEKELAWINSRKDIIESLNKIDISADKFNWWFREVVVMNDDGSRSPALWIKGYATILCVLQPLIDEKDQDSILPRPFYPELDDDKYYYSYAGI